MYWLPIAVARSILPDLLLEQIWHWGFLVFHIEWEECEAFAMYAKFKILTVKCYQFLTALEKILAQSLFCHVNMNSHGYNPSKRGINSQALGDKLIFISVFKLIELFQSCLSLLRKACINSPDFFQCLDI